MPEASTEGHHMDYMIETFDLVKRFGSLTAVDRLSFKVGQGEIFGLLGPNGAGKSTTISMLCTIMRPTSGTATVNGYDIVREAGRVRKSIGIVFQDPSIDDRLTGLENMEMHADLYDVPRDVMHSRIDEVLKLVELEDRATSLVSTYSGGMRRRLEIARSLIHYPKVLFLDEPTIGLDPQSRDHIWSYIRDLKKRENITIILTTHYMDEADKLCDRIAIIDRSRIVALDTPRALKDQMEGEMIVIKSGDNGLLASKLTEARLVDRITVNNGELSLSVKNAHTALPRVVEVAGASGIYLESISLREADLDDVFMHYTGRNIRQSGSKELTGFAAIRRRQIK
jgi:ABC-2 type transport system ATP-binding protein